MNVIIVDTSSWISFFRGQNLPELELALKEGRVMLPPIVAAELLSGPQSPAQEKELEVLVRELPLCETPIDHWIRVGTLRQKLNQKGLSVSTPDAHIAQCALDLEGYLMSEDHIFQKIAAALPLKLIHEAGTK